jgi:hypothetical protein
MWAREARRALIIISLSIGIVTALADAKLPPIAERTEVQIKTISAVMDSFQSTINSASLHISDICSVDNGRNEGIKINPFDWFLVLSHFSAPRFFFLLSRCSGIHDIAPIDRVKSFAEIIFLEPAPEEKSMLAGVGENLTCWLILMSFAGSLPTFSKDAVTLNGLFTLSG